MKKLLPYPLYVSCILMIICACSEKKTSSWKLAENHLVTRWSSDISVDEVWQEYPRPQMVREAWMNLNGLWEFALVPVDSVPVDYKDEILVPFPVESALSGVGKRVGQQQKVWYRRNITIPPHWKNKKILLHFEASDWETTVRIDGQEAGTHRGGYNPFSFDISSFVRAGKNHRITVTVWDPTDEGFQPRGKQASKPGGIWYTPSTGIWQTVWLEPVPESYIESFRFTTDIDKEMVVINTNIENPGSNTILEVEVRKDDVVITTKDFPYDQQMEVAIPDPELWSPDDPFLYDLTLRLIHDGDVTDELTSYFGMRKISLAKDEHGFNRLALNNSILFQNGPLDQGFWPDGLNTPPSDEAMKYDIEVTKAMGFNMLRKHVKVENRRFYRWCDEIGVLVWQDMPSAAGYVAPDGPDLHPSEEQRRQFEYELGRMIHTHINHPSIIMWVPFNEGWGQYDTEKIVDFVRSADSTRLVNNASGWTDRNAGDVIDIHHYPDPRYPEPEEHRASVLGEFGGLGLYVEGHTWQKENWGYEKLQEVDELLSKYEGYYQQIRQMRAEYGLAAVVYTQTTDVETETNGLMTYDRDRVKMGIENIRKAHAGIIPPALRSSLRDFIEEVEVELVSGDPDASIQYSIKIDTGESKWTEFTQPFQRNESFTLQAKCVWPNGEESRISTFEFSKVKPRAAIAIPSSQGLNVSRYEGSWDQLPDFEGLIPVEKGIAEKVGLEFSNTHELFGLEFEGFLDVPETGVYLFYLSSDDGARFYLDGEEFIDYDGIHGAGIRKATAALEKGLHPFRLVYFQKYGGLGLNIYWESQEMKYSEIHSGNWKH